MFCSISYASLQQYGLERDVMPAACVAPAALLPSAGAQRTMRCGLARSAADPTGERTTMLDCLHLLPGGRASAHPMNRSVGWSSYPPCLWHEHAALFTGTQRPPASYCCRNARERTSLCRSLVRGAPHPFLQADVAGRLDALRILDGDSTGWPAPWVSMFAFGTAPQTRAFARPSMYAMC